MAPDKKVRLDITIRSEFKEMARELARQRRRSISALLEDLILAEIEREKSEQKAIGFHWPKDCPEGGQCSNCRTIIDKIKSQLHHFAPSATIMAMLSSQVAA
jgi:ferredoxin